MRTLVCPVSPLRLDRTVVRLTGLMMALMIVLYALTGSIIFIVAIAVDYCLRAFTPMTYSPFSWLAMQITRGLGWQGDKINKAPKMFAARVGFLFALASALLYLINPTLSLVVALTLMLFALLESVLDFCVGCKVYSLVMLPLFGEK